jgi:nucleotide-binding universal stress UspA family protein
MFKHILLATDGSAASLHAAELAVGLARTHGAKLTAVYVVDPYPYIGVGEINPMGYQAYSAAAQQQVGPHRDLCAGQSTRELQARLVEMWVPPASSRLLKPKVWTSLWWAPTAAPARLMLGKFQQVGESGASLFRARARHERS